MTDALGRLTQVVEAPGSLNYTTDYTYDTLGNLRQVNQGGQNRYFLYDSVGRLVRARNLEQDVNTGYNLTDPVTGAGNNQWVLKYAYDENGNLKKRWDARGVAASYNYDDINRNYNIGYSGGTPATPSVERYYDGATRGKGRPWSTVSYHAHPITGQAAYQFRQVTTYDENGRPTQGNQQFLNSSSQWVIYTMSRSYDLMGHVTGQNYPSGRAANYSYTAAGRLSGFSGNLGDGVPRTYADQMAYNAAGQMTSERFGTQTQLYHNMYYNSRFQMWANYLGTTAGGWNRGALFTYYSVTARNAGAPAGEYSGNNGNVWMGEHYVPTNDAITTHTVFRDIYEYDDLNRLKQDTGVQKDVANNWTTPHQQAFNFDQWGNRTINAGATFGANINNLAFTASTATNRLDKPGGSVCTGSKNGMCYDQAGNLIFDNYSASPGGDREYDGENRMTKGWGTGGWNYYVYDGDGQRVRRVVWVSGVQVEYWQVYDFDGALIAEYLANGAPATTNKEYGYRGGQMLLVGGCDVARWLVNDQLGTPRIEVDVTGSLANVRRHDYLSFGEELTAGMGNGSLRSAGMGYAADCVRQRFGSKERDNETGLDWFSPGRYFTSVQGRFTSVDPLLSSGDVYTPQSWNRYAYAFNNPLRFIDPFGLYNWDASAGGSFTDDELRTRSKDKTLSRRDRNDAKKALGFRDKFRSALDQAHQAAGSSRLNSDESQSVASAANSYGTENDDNGVNVGRKSRGGPGSTLLNDDDTINVVFRDNVKKNDLVTVVTHEGQHVADAQAFLASPIANSWTDLTHYEREERAFYTGAYTAQALNMKNYPAKADIKVWERGWKEADRATKMSRAVEAYIHRGYSGLSPANPGDRYSEEYKGRRVP